MKIYKKIKLILLILLSINCHYRISYNPILKQERIERYPALALKAKIFAVDDTLDALKKEVGYKGNFHTEMKLYYEKGIANYESSALILNDKTLNINTKVKIKNRFTVAQAYLIFILRMLTIDIFQPIEKYTINILVQIENADGIIIEKNYETEIFYEIVGDSIYYLIYAEKQSEEEHKPMLMEYYGNFISRDLATEIIVNCYNPRITKKENYCKYFQKKVF